MTRSKVIILNLKGLYNVLLELKEFFKFELSYQEKEADLSEQSKGKNCLVISNKKILSNIDNKVPIFSGKSFLAIIVSTNPHFIVCSAVWKFSGNSSLIVDSITRRPAKIISAPGSAI